MKDWMGISFSTGLPTIANSFQCVPCGIFSVTFHICKKKQKIQDLNGLHNSALLGV